MVDDGSTDDTKNIAEEMREKAEFPMRYIYKENGGKHTALNVGVKQITSELTFIVDSDDMPCNGTKDKEVMGNLNTQSWDELWNSPQAEEVRKKVRCCDRDCWMIGSVSPAMHKYIWKPATWVLVHKFKALFTKHPYSMYELKICRDYRDGKVTKEELDKCSTCDMDCVINNGLSEASKEQLKHKTGEEIVDADIAQQMEMK